MSEIKQLNFNLSELVVLELIWCDPGSFVIGSPESELGHYDDEGPQHLVTLSQGFYLGKFPVTQEQYQAAAGKNPSAFTDDGEKRPVEGVSWDDAQHFCRLLNSRYSEQLPSGYKFALPTEAQWEYACRAGSTSALNNGQNLTCAEGACATIDKLAWYRENSGRITHPVGQKEANAWGFYDMLGNVQEWCSDLYDSRYSEQSLDPMGTSNDFYSLRVYRGGAFFEEAKYCRSARRDGDAADNAGCENHGFRLALVPLFQ